MLAYRAGMDSRLILVSLTAAAPMVAGCAPQARIALPAQVSSENWSMASEGELPVAVDAGAIEDAFGSAELAALLAAARASNTDIAIAAARIDQARGLLRAARGRMLPVVNASAGIRRSSGGGAGNPFDFSEGFADLDIGYELDLFGENRSNRNAARERLRAAEFDRAAVMLAVEADVARAFVRRAALAERIAILDRNTAQARELERIIGARVRAGDATRVDLGLQTIQVRRLEAERTRLTEALDRTRTALAVLTGAEAPGFRSSPAPIADLAVPALSPAQPALLLARRPDIKASEALILAANGDVQAARAAFFPRISLSARGLLELATLGGALQSGRSLGADILAPIFGRGRLQGEFDFATGRQREAAETYRRTLLSALAEVEDAMSASAASRERETILESIVAEARITARLARLQYVGGEADLVQVLDAEQLLSEAEDAAIVSRLERLEAAIDLYRAMGGNALAAG